MKRHSLLGNSRQRRSWEVGESRPGEIEGVAVAAITPVLIHDGYRRRGIARSHQRQVDARVSQQSSEDASVVVPGKRSEVGDWKPEPAERDRRVERPTARHWAQHASFLDEIDKCLAGDDNHAARPFGVISPEPRAISVTGKTSCTDGEASPSSRRNKSSAAVRPSACGSWAITEIGGIKNVGESHVVESNQRHPTLEPDAPQAHGCRRSSRRFWLVNSAVGGFGERE